MTDESGTDRLCQQRWQELRYTHIYLQAYKSLFQKLERSVCQLTADVNRFARESKRYLQRYLSVLL